MEDGPTCIPAPSSAPAHPPLRASASASSSTLCPPHPRPRLLPCLLPASVLTRPVDAIACGLLTDKTLIVWTITRDESNFGIPRKSLHGCVPFGSPLSPPALGPES